MKAVFVAIFACLAGPLAAQGSLGITGASLSVGVIEDEAGATQVEGAAVVDVAITDVHGFQGDLVFADTASGAVGALGAHLYMAPRRGQKYGLFATLGDIDGRALTYVSLGAEGMLALNSRTTLEGQAGIGAANDGNLDYIFASLALSRALSTSTVIEAALDVAEFDEMALRAVSYDTSLTARYSPEGAPWGLYAQISHGGLTGRDARAGKTRIGLGLTMTFGTSGGTSPKTRPFRSIDPLAPLMRRGLW